MPVRDDVEGPIAFARARVFDGEDFHDDWTVVVDGARIAAAGPGVEPPPGAHVVAREGVTLTPGLIDTHVHLGLHLPSLVLASGVTTVRDLGWPLDRVAALQHQDGPRVLFAGPMLTAPRGYPTRASWAPKGTGREVDHRTARAAVAELAEAGACVIKVAQEPRAGPLLAHGTLEVIAEEARKHGLGVASHVGSLEQLDLAIEAGVTELAHGLWSDEEIPDETLRLMDAAGVTLIPTLHIHPHPARIDAVARYHAIGGRIVYGTDMGNEPIPPGFDVEEATLMLDAGMSTADVLRAATSAAADLLGLPDAGRIRAGARADVALFNGDASADLRALGRPIVVLRAGAMVLA
ncbi:MAG TPA: amidohydrolase family protein [Actinomycetota bacterium]